MLEHDHGIFKFGGNKEKKENKINLKAYERRRKGKQRNYIKMNEK